MKEISSEQFLPNTQQGFSLVELIIVIILLGTLSVFVAPKFLGKSGIAEIAYASQLETALRKVQIQAMQDSRANICYQMNFDTQSSASAYGVPTEDFSTINASNTCASTIDFSSAAHKRTNADELNDEGIVLQALDGSDSINFIAFDGMGRPVTNQGTCQNQCRVSFVAEQSAVVCIESQGYVHVCDS